MYVLVGSLCPGWQMGQVECKVKVNGLPMNTSVGVLYRKRTKALTSSLGNARIPGAPWSVKYTNTWSSGPLTNKHKYITSKPVRPGDSQHAMSQYYTHWFSETQSTQAFKTMFEKAVIVYTSAFHTSFSRLYSFKGHSHERDDVSWLGLSAPLLGPLILASSALFQILPSH